MNQDKTCKTCKHFAPLMKFQNYDQQISFARCTNQRAQRTNHATGEYYQAYAETMRMFISLCGESGAWHEPVTNNDHQEAI